MADDSPADCAIPLWRVLEEEYCELEGRPLPGAYLQQRDKELNSIRDGRGTIEQENAAILPLVFGLIHRLPKPRVGLCLSGGGIRSATFTHLPAREHGQPVFQ
ncbi:MAG TPA: hypothetical protein VLJ39_12785 [Tepidisphaeraceae bacterium]|jgi:hypothetical protein|nr:hypothetical protein [Tepidisphaeraceae bacterium]